MCNMWNNWNMWNIWNIVNNLKKVQLVYLSKKINFQSADIFIHLAGPSSGPASSKDPKGTIDMSNRGIFNGLELFKKLVFLLSFF